LIGLIESLNSAFRGLAALRCLRLCYAEAVSTITAILEVDADGTLHLPAPPELRHGKVIVKATLKAADESFAALPRVTSEMLQSRREAFQKLRQLNPFRNVDDPAAWQREIRQDRPLPGRD
jgi:hypothetical protein